MVKLLVGAGCFVTFWANYPGLGASLQELVLLFFALAAVLALLQGSVRIERPSGAEWVLYATALLSAAVAICRQIEPCIWYSMAFLLALISISIVVRALSLQEILGVGARTTLMLVLISTIYYHSQFLKALSISMTHEGLYRFEPFENHPNLIGFIFGAGSILMAREVFLAGWKWERFAMAAGVLAAWVFLIAASARASVLALAVAGAVALIKEWRPTKKALAYTCGALSLAVVGLTVSRAGAWAFDYLTKILEINSRTRGFGSGASGRVDSWHQSMNFLTSNPMLLLFGGSMRSSDSRVIGFDATEDSYITILLDSGIFAGTAVMLVILFYPVRAMIQSREFTRERGAGLLLISLFVFLLVESIFNRYLLAIGNPVSPVALMALVSISLRRAQSVASNRANSARDEFPAGATAAR